MNTSPPFLLRIPELLFQEMIDQAIVELPNEKRTPEQQAAVVNYVRSIDQELGRLLRSLSDYPVPPTPRVLGAQDLAWALMNSPAFLFNH